MTTRTPEASEKPEEPKNELPSASQVERTIIVKEGEKSFWNPEAAREVAHATLERVIQDARDSEGPKFNLNTHRYDKVSWPDIEKSRTQRGEGEPGFTFQVMTREERSGPLGMRKKVVELDEAVVVIDMNNGDAGSEAKFVAAHVNLVPGSKPPQLLTDGEGKIVTTSTKIFNEGELREAYEGKAKGGEERLNAQWLKGEIDYEEYQKGFETSTLWRRTVNSTFLQGLYGGKLTFDKEEQRQLEAIPHNEGWRIAERERPRLLEQLGETYQERMEQYRTDLEAYLEEEKENLARLPDLREKIAALGGAIGPEGVQALVELYGLGKYTDAGRELRRLAGRGHAIARSELAAAEQKERAERLELELGESQRRNEGLESELAGLREELGLALENLGQIRTELTGTEERARASGQLADEMLQRYQELRGARGRVVAHALRQTTGALREVAEVGREVTQEVGRAGAGVAEAVGRGAAAVARSARRRGRPAVAAAKPSNGAGPDTEEEVAPAGAGGGGSSGGGQAGGYNEYGEQISS